jgi:tetratricopeptide (TPR) repeat protein
VAHGQLLFEIGDWPGAIAQFDAAARGLQKIEAETKGWRSAAFLLRSSALPFEAIAYAKLGKFDRADSILKTLPTDCDICSRARGKAEAVRKNWNASASWFHLVSARSPDIPFADSDWGEMLLREGKYDAAIAQFTTAHAKGPHFADPLEMWGEALMRENRSDLALAKFEEANTYAPNWGRLHLEWGNALFYAGRRGDAHRQFAAAANLDLSASDKMALARWQNRTTH